MSVGSVTWTFQGSKILFADEGRRYHPIYHQLFIRNVQLKHAGTYVCHGRNEDNNYFIDEGVLFVGSKS